MTNTIMSTQEKAATVCECQFSEVTQLSSKLPVVTRLIKGKRDHLCIVFSKVQTFFLSVR